MFFVCAVAGAVVIVGSPGPAIAAGRAATKPGHATKARDWTTVVSSTAAGGFVMGNPSAKVKLVEYGSMTCPHCREFDATGVPHLLNDFVKTGKVSWEFRNYVRDAFDVTASLVARCNGPKGFFPLTRALFANQQNWEKRINDVPASDREKLRDLPHDQLFVALAKLAGFQEFAAGRGLPPARSNQCLANEASVERLAQMAQDANTSMPDFPGTPTFLINGKMVELGPVTADQVWPSLQSKIEAALSAHD